MEPGQGAANAGSKKAASFIQLFPYDGSENLKHGRTGSTLLPDLKAPRCYTGLLFSISK